MYLVKNNISKKSIVINNNHYLQYISNTFHFVSKINNNPNHFFNKVFTNILSSFVSKIEKKQSWLFIGYWLFIALPCLLLRFLLSLVIYCLGYLLVVYWLFIG